MRRLGCPEVVRRVAAWCILSLGLAVPTPAFAEVPEAQALFEQGRRLLKAGELSKACTTFAESWRLEHAGVTLLNLAACHRDEGKTATAWAEFREAEAFAARTGRRDRTEEAARQAEQLRGRLSYVTFSATWTLAGASLTLDGKPLARETWAAPMPLDPGEHTAVVGVNGTPSYEMPVVVPPGPATTAIVLRAPTAAPSAPVTRPVTRDEAPVEAHASSRISPYVYVAGAVGLASLATSGIFGVLALDKKGDLRTECNANVCTPAGIQLHDEAKQRVLFGDVFLAVGLVAVGVATVLYLTQPTTTAHGR